MYALLVILAFVVAPGEAVSAPGEPVVASEHRFETLVIHSEGLDAARLRDRIDLRLAERSVRVYEEGTSTDPQTAVLQVRPVGDELALSLVLPDGGAYFRTISVTPEQRERIVATTVANLISAIEANQVNPDREGVSAQEVLDDPGAAQDQLEELVVQRPKETTPSEDPVRKVSQSPPEEEVSPSVKEPPEDESSPPPTTRARGLEVGLALAPTVAVGFPQTPAFRGVGGEAAVSLTLASGALMRLGGRGLGQANGEYGLGRLRIAVGAGYDARVGQFELPVWAGLSVEPWWVAGGDTPSAQQGAPVPLWGGHLRAEPSYRLDVKNKALAVRFGLALELGASAEFRDGVTTPVVRQTPADPALFRFGGPEVAAGLVFEFRIPTSQRDTGTS